MKRLWKIIPPCLSDVLGFEAVVNETEGLGIVDDPSTYKPLRLGGTGGGPGHGWGGPRGMGGHGYGQGDPRGAGEHSHGQGSPRSAGEHGYGQGGPRGAGEHGYGQGGPRGVGEPGYGQGGPHGSGDYGHGQRGGEFGHGGQDFGPHGGNPRDGGRVLSERGADGRGADGRGADGRGRRRGGIRTLDSEIRNEDIIRGTEGKVMETFRFGCEQFHPDFVLLSLAPSSSMIGSDLDAYAERITAESGIPAASVKTDGEKDYLYGISRTLETMGKLLLTPGDTVAGTVNLLGCNTVDWTKETLEDVQSWLESLGLRVISRWGVKETTENLRRGAKASVNLVVNVSGMRLARYMEQEYGIPYIAGAPFGANSCRALERALAPYAGEKTDALSEATASSARTAEISARTAVQPAETADTSARTTKISAQTTGLSAGTGDASAPAAPEILIICEQILGNALRQALLSRGAQNIQVASFYDMDKSLMLPGDRKLPGEDDLAKLLNQGSVKLVFGDPDYLPVADRELAWIALPNYGSLAPIDGIPHFNMATSSFDRWLDGALAEKGWNIKG